MATVTRIPVTVSVSSVNAHTDGKTHGEWDAVLSVQTKSGLHEKTLHGTVRNMTDNAVQIFAVLESILALKVPCEVNVVCKNGYVANTGANMKRWYQDGWKTASGKAMANQRQWLALFNAAKAGQHKLKFEQAAKSARPKAVSRPAAQAVSVPSASAVSEPAAQALADAKTLAAAVDPSIVDEIETAAAAAPKSAPMENEQPADEFAVELPEDAAQFADAATEDARPPYQETMPRNLWGEEPRLLSEEEKQEMTEALRAKGMTPMEEDLCRIDPRLVTRGRYLMLHGRPLML